MDWRSWRWFGLGCAVWWVFGAPDGWAQDNYEIQVYGFETVPAGRTMIELHSNYTVTEGFTSWFETGFYVFSSIQPGEGWQWGGRSHPTAS